MSLFLCYALNAQFPVVIEDISVVGIKINVEPEYYSEELAISPYGHKWVASDFIYDPDADFGYYYWFEIDIPDPFVATSGWIKNGFIMAYGEPGYMLPDCGAEYVEVTTPTLSIREDAGVGEPNITIDGNYAYAWLSQKFACTGSTEIISGTTWYEIYLPTNCSQLTGWCSAGAGGTLLDYHPSGSGDCEVPDEPEDFSVEAISESEIQLDWTDPGGLIDGYVIYHCDFAFAFEYTTATEYIEDFLDEDTEYEYYIKAYNMYGASNETSCESAFTEGGCDPPGIPDDLTAVAVSPYEIELNWDSEPDADYYEIYLCGGIYIGETVSSDFDFNELGGDPLIPGTTYSVKVRAVNDDCGPSDFTSCVEEATLPEDPDLPSAPEDLIAIATGPNSIHVSWSEPDFGDVEGYNLYKCAPPILWYDEITSTEIEITGLIPDTEYFLQVVAYNIDEEEGAFAPCIAVTTDPEVVIEPETPEDLFAIPVSPTEIQLIWEEAEGASYYKVYSCGGLYITTVFTPEYLHTGLLPGTFYNYKVNSWNIDGDFSTYSDCASATTPLDETPPPSPSELNALAISPNDIYLNWDIIIEATHYEIYFCDDDIPVGISVTNEFYASGLSPDTYYEYYVRSFNGAIPSDDFSPCAGATTLESEPAIEYLKAINNVPYVSYLVDEQTIEYYEEDDLYITPIKICADGSEATIIEVKVADEATINDLRFRITSDPFGIDSELSGWFIIDDYEIDGDVLRARYTHPKYLNVPEVFRSDQIEIFNIATEAVVFTYPIQIYRAPLIMVHGLFGTPSAFNDMDEEYNALYPNVLKWKINFEGSNDVSFNDNADVVPNEVECRLVECIDNGYSTGKVDIIAHSMGGVLSRLYLQSDYYNNDVHKLITINTPHSGSEVADYFYPAIIGEDLFDVPFFFDLTDLISDGMDLIGFSIFNGAVEDLRVESNEIDNNLNSASNIDNNTVPSHVIVTSVEEEEDMEEDELHEIFKTIADVFYDEEIFEFYNEHLFGYVSHDGIVSISSQLGGLYGDPSTTGFLQKHRGAANNPEVIEAVADVIDLSPTSSYFTSEFNPVDLSYSYIFRTEESTTETDEVNNGSVNIITPIVGQDFENGSTISILVEAADSVNNLILFIGSDFTKKEIISLDPSLSTYSYSIRNNFIGNIYIYVLGASDNSFGWDSVVVNVNCLSVLDSITLSPSPLYVIKGFQRPIQIIGNYSDGVEREISYLEGFEFNTLIADIAFRDSLNLIKGIDTGTTQMVIDYFGISKLVDVHVIPANEGLVDFIDSLETEIFEYEQEESDLEHFANVNPNPFNKTAVLEYYLSDPSYIELRIFDLNGTLLSKLKIGMEESGKNYIELNATDLPSGIYLYKLLSTNSEQTGKFVVAH